MRKPHDFDAELKVLAEKARRLKERRVRQLGELVIACGADALDADLLAGALLYASSLEDTETKEGWRKAGQALFHDKSGKPPVGASKNLLGAISLGGSKAST